jgi:hypothetical protein
MVVAVTDTYVVTISGPTDEWTNTLPMIETAIASIQAESTQRAPADRLTKTVQWYDVRLRVPDNFESSNYGPNRQDSIGFSTSETRIQLATTFSPQGLLIELRNFSSVRHLFTLESLLLHGRIQWYQGDVLPMGDIRLFEIGGFEAARLDFTYFDTRGMGQAVALRTSDSMYLVVGVANPEQWKETERELFEAILATVERGE